jgi:hypothetical protein
MLYDAPENGELLRVMSLNPKVDFLETRTSIMDRRFSYLAERLGMDIDELIAEVNGARKESLVLRRYLRSPPDISKAFDRDGGRASSLGYLVARLLLQRRGVSSQQMRQRRYFVPLLLVGLLSVLVEYQFFATVLTSAHNSQPIFSAIISISAYLTIHAALRFALANGVRGSPRALTRSIGDLSIVTGYVAFSLIAPQNLYVAGFWHALNDLFWWAKPAGRSFEMVASSMANKLQRLGSVMTSVAATNLALFVGAVERENRESAIAWIADLAAAVEAKKVGDVLGQIRWRLNEIDRPTEDRDMRMAVYVAKNLLKPAFQREVVQAIKSRAKDAPGASGESAEEKTVLILALLLAELRPMDRPIVGNVTFLLDASLNYEDDELIRAVAITASLIRYGGVSSAGQNILAETDVVHDVHIALTRLQRWGMARHATIYPRNVHDPRQIREWVQVASIVVHGPQIMFEKPDGVLAVDFDQEFLIPLRHLRISNLFKTLRAILIAA